SGSATFATARLRFATAATRISVSNTSGARSGARSAGAAAADCCAAVAIAGGMPTSTARASTRRIRGLDLAHARTRRTVSCVDALSEALPLALSAAIYPPALLVLLLLLTGDHPRRLVLAYF